jgi:putative peptidoglycan lipid II flippase
VFPGTGLLVISSLCLAVLNSHHRFLLSYAAPVLWNIAIISALLVAGTNGLIAEEVAVYAAAGALVGSALQLVVQLPSVLALLGGVVPRLRAARDELTSVIRRFVPAVMSRGSVQFSAYIDTFLVNRLPGIGAFSALGYAQQLYQLPISLFGMAVSAAELPGLSAAAGGRVRVGSPQALELCRRTGAASRRAVFFVLPSAVALAIFGNHIVGLIFLRGAFTVENVVTTWVILCGFAIGVVPATLGRLIATAFFAMHDTRTPLWFSLVRIVLGTALAVLLMYGLPQAMSPAIFDGREGLRVAGLSFAGAIGFWFEFALLYSAFERAAGSPERRAGYATAIVACVVVATAVGMMTRMALADPASGMAERLFVGDFASIPTNIAVIASFGLTYLLLTAVFGVSEVAAFIRSRLGR